MADQWFTNGKANIGIVMGAISDNALALDFDDPGLARFAFDLEELAEVTFVEQTPRGYHVVFRTEGGPVRTTSFSGRGLALDLKGEGGYIAAAPSMHPNGTPYKLLSPDVRIARIGMNELDALLRRLLTRQPALPGLGLAVQQESPPEPDVSQLPSNAPFKRQDGESEAGVAAKGRPLRPAGPRVSTRRHEDKMGTQKGNA